ERAVACVVIRMLMRDEDRAQLSDRQVRQGQLARDAVAAIDEIDAIANDDGLRRCGAADFRRRSAGCAQQHQTRVELFPFFRAPHDRRAQARCAPTQKRPTRDRKTLSNIPPFVVPRFVFPPALLLSMWRDTLPPRAPAIVPAAIDDDMPRLWGRNAPPPRH